MVSLRLKQVLDEKGLTQAELAHAIGVSEMTVSAWTTGRRFPSIETLDRISDFLDVQFTSLFTETRRPRLTLQVRIGSKTIPLTSGLILAAARQLSSDSTII